MYNFCTYFDANYFVRGLTLYRSLARYAGSFRLWILCLDEVTYGILQQLDLPNVLPIALADFEEGDEALLQAKGNRSRVEYYFTCTPSLPLHVLKNHPDVDVITYLDADLLFFSDPSPIYEELGDNSILLIQHRFPPHLKYLQRNGIYNVSYLSFRRDENGLQCLNWWRERCIEWCYDRVEDDRFADQKYLDDWPERFSRAVVLQHKGANLAPWNVGNYSLSLKDGQILVDSYPLVFFHFCDLKQLKQWLVNPNLQRYELNVDHLLKKHIYEFYIRELQETASWMTDSSFMNRLPRGMHLSSARYGNPYPLMHGSVFRRMGRKVKLQLVTLRRLLQGQYWLVIGGRII